MPPQNSAQDKQLDTTSNIPPALPRQDAPIDATANTLRQIRTFQGDVAEALRKQNESILSIREAELARKDLLNKSSSAENPELKKRLVSAALVTLSIVLVAGGGVAAWFSYQEYLRKTAVPALTLPSNRFLPATTEREIGGTNLSRDQLVSVLTSARAGSNLREGNIEHIQIVKGVGADAEQLRTTELLLAIRAQPPGHLVRAFRNEFMLGILGEVPKETFLLIKLSSFENAFAGMLEWESRMEEDLLPLFVNPGELGDSSSQSKFEDITIKNKDARVLRDANGKSIFIYSFYDRNLLIITGSEAALRTLVTKLTTQALSR